MAENDSRQRFDLEVAQRRPLRARERTDLLLGKADVLLEPIVEAGGGPLEVLLGRDEALGIPAIELTREPPHRIHAAALDPLEHRLDASTDVRAGLFGWRPRSFQEARAGGEHATP